MKQLFTILVALLTSFTISAQVVLNEIYADPSRGNNEFFELYNTSYFGSPVSLDGYTIMSYFEEGNKKGFYIIDLPNLSIAPRGYIAGSSSIPFNYQGNLGSTASDFSWNSPSLSANYGYIKKWVATGNSISDGNQNYNEEALPADFNDFFSRHAGNGASYNALVFKNGVLVNSFVGGTGGLTAMPDYITSMPVFQIENVTAFGNNTYGVVWGSFNSTKPEFVIQDIGTDNGFIRKRDGMCGTWEKSSSTVQHTPRVTNGGSQMDVAGLLTLDTHIYSPANDSDSAIVVYNITAGPSDLFPVELQVYADNGSVPGQLDANDISIGVNTENALSDGPFTTHFTPQRQDILVVAKTTTGCFDQIRLVRNPESVLTTLPVKLKRFTGKVANGKSMLEWVVTSNEAGKHFEIFKSSNGKEFTKVDVVFAGSDAGEAYYTYSGEISNNQFYKIKVVNKDKSSTYSPVVFIEHPQNSTADKLSILRNPVQAFLPLTYQAGETGVCTITIYNSLGLIVTSTQVTAQKGFNTFTVNLDQKITSGLYILEVIRKGRKNVERFFKHQ